MHVRGDKPAYSKARFKRRILHAPNAIQTMHNEEAYLIIYCLNCIRCMQNSTFETGLSMFIEIWLYINVTFVCIHICLTRSLNNPYQQQSIIYL